MKKILLSLSLLMALSTVKAQNQYSFGFDGTTAGLETAGWTRTNQSTSASSTLWSVATYGPVVVNLAATPPVQPNAFSDQAYTTGQTSPAPQGHSGGTNSFALVNYTSTSSALPAGATISNWLISPVITVQNGDVVSFATRLGKYSATSTASYADNLQLRMSENAELTTNPSAGPLDMGDFTNLLVEVNPNFNLTSYPTTWTTYSYTIAGLNGPTAVKFGFRYYVINGGPNGSNSDIIGIDSFSVDRTLATADFFASNFAVYPNPASNVLNVDSKNAALSQVQLTDINGRIVKDIKVNGVSSQINISDLNAGVYFLKATSAQGSGTTKIVKN